MPCTLLFQEFEDCDDFQTNSLCVYCDACELKCKYSNCSTLLNGLHKLLPAGASEQGNVIGLVSVYIHVYTKKIVIEQIRDLIYLKLVSTDFFPKIISPSAGENSGDSAYPLLFCSFYFVDYQIVLIICHFCHTHYLTPDQV